MANRQPTDSGVGGSYVGRIGVVVATVVIVLATVLIVAALLMVWPPALPAVSTTATTGAPPTSSTAGTAVPTTQPSAATATSRVGQPTATTQSPGTTTTTGGAEANLPPVAVFGAKLHPSREARLFLVVLLAGALGGMAHVLRSLYWYAGNRTLVRSWLVMYATVPFVAAVLALIFYLLLRGGLVSTRTSSDDISPYGMAAFAALVGLFSRQTAAKLKVVFETLLAPGEKGADHTGPASDTGQPSGQPSGPRITVLEPASARAGDTVAIRGTGLAAASAVRIGSIDVPQFTVVSDRELSIVVPSGTQTANVTVVTPAGSAVSRHPLEVLPTTP